MNQPFITIPTDTSTTPPSAQAGAQGTMPNSPLSNLLSRLAKSSKDRSKVDGAFGGKGRSARHQGLIPVK